MATGRFAVSPGTMFERLISDAAALLSFDIVRVADPNWLPGLVVVAVKLALDLSDVTVRPISTSAESAKPAASVVGCGICAVPSASASPVVPFAGGRSERNYLRRTGLGHQRVEGDAPL